MKHWCLYYTFKNYARSPFWDSESYIRSVIGLDEDVIHFVNYQIISNFVICEIPPGIYTTKDISEAVYTMADRGTPRIEYDIISLETKLILSPSVKLRFIEKSFYNKLLGFAPF